MASNRAIRPVNSTYTGRKRRRFWKLHRRGGTQWKPKEGRHTSFPWCANLQGECYTICITRMRGFEWDATKDRANRRKHGFGFSTAARGFADPNMVLME